jgi:RNA recognition motif-containing protein
VGNLSYKTTQESLRRFFDAVGEITRVHLPTKPGNAPPGESARRENKGFAYVDFATLEAKKAAVVMTESPLDGRRLLIKDGDNFEGRPQNAGIPGAGDGAVTQGKNLSSFARKILSVQKQPPAPTLFFGNLGFNTTVDSIRGLLEAHRAQPGPAGEDVVVDAPPDPWIRKIRMGTFEDSGLCKGFAFVDFTSTEHATAALLHPKNHHLDGRKLVVEYASVDAVRRGGGPGSRPKKVSSLVAAARSERRESVVGNRDERKSLETPSVPRDEKSVDAGRRSGAAKNGTRKSRPAPGAALALAKREQVAIVPSQGRRITFDD